MPELSVVQLNISDIFKLSDYRRTDEEPHFFRFVIIDKSINTNIKYLEISRRASNKGIGKRGKRNWKRFNFLCIYMTAVLSRQNSAHLTSLTRGQGSASGGSYERSDPVLA